MIDNIQVGKTIAKLRQNKNMTQQQLAAALSVSHQAVSKWETGAALPDVQTLVALTRLFGITIEQLLEGEVLEDRVEPPKPASPFDEPIQNIGNFVNNIVNGLFRNDRKDAEDDGDENANAEKPSQAQEAANAEAPEAGEAGEAGQEAGPFDVQTLYQMAPFMSKAAVDELLLENRDKLTPADIARFAPYASQECLEKLIQTNDAQLDWDVLRRVAPFLRRDMVDNLARTAAKGKRTVRRAMDQSGINTDDLGRTVQDVGQKIGEGVERALRRASKLGGEVMEEMSSAINGMVESVREKQSRAEALRKAACER
ncbi:MAG: helix-turn-helix transcriptional regulator, partial [Clostridia bacterium]|nr:helix-turn-helix transcriptional regulator [Clostridia bacterium]